MTAIELTVPCVAAHLLVTPQPGTDLRCDRCGASASLPLEATCDDHHPRPLPRPMVLRFLPTDADTECETCGGSGGGYVRDRFDPAYWDHEPCDDCDSTGRRPLRAGDRIAIRADDNVPADFTVVGPYRVRHAGPRAGLTDLEGEHLVTFLAPGDIAGYATVANVLPIYHVAPVWISGNVAWPNIQTNGPGVVTWGDGTNLRDLSDHLDAGLVFTPGQVALELDGLERPSGPFAYAEQVPA